MQSSFFSMCNVHVASCGAPPNFSNEDPGRYHGYFENQHGEQWVFTYDRSTKTALLRGGDAGWDQVYQVIDGQAPDLILSPEELLWLKSCWAAATR